MKPTQEQLERFWKGYGFKHQDYVPSFGNLPEQKEAWLYPDGSMCFLSSFGTATGLPPITLDNLFKYAVPEAYPTSISFDYTKKSYECRIKKFRGSYLGKGKSEELALFWALDKVREETKDAR